MSIKDGKHLDEIKVPRNTNLDIRVSLKNKYVFFMVCKSASSTLTYHLQMAEYKGTLFKVKNVNNHYESPHLRRFQFRDEDFIEILNSPDYKKVAFVRNPYTRVLSCYLHRILNEKRINPSKQAIYSKTSFSDENKPSFMDFISFIADQDPIYMERHWQVQTANILHDYVDFDFIGKQENLINDLVSMENLIFGKEIFDRKKLESVNLSPMITNARSQTSEFYNDKAIQIVADCYKSDFDAFGYSFDLPG